MSRQLSLPNEVSSLKIPYKKDLNASQYEAVISTEGPLLVIAGAGSGKTRTLTYRVAYLVEQGVSPASILLLTFTRKASHEMLRRAAQLLDNRCEGVAGGTFHSFSNAMLRKYAPEIGFGRDFSILDRVDSEDLINMLRKDLGFVSKFQSFPRKHTLANIFSRAINKVLTVEDVVLDEYPHFSHAIEAIITLSEEYRKQKSHNNFLDYDDLLLQFKFLLEQNEETRNAISSKYDYIMVDEYQDTNKIQAEIIFHLSRNNRNIMVVGDDSQSIYAFRGANFKNIMNFPEQFSGTRVIGLEENYRSIQPILDLTNVIIERAEEKYSKKLFTRRSGENIPLLVETESENSQSKFIIEKILQLNREGAPYGEMSVLFRASFHSFDLEIELSKNGIPFIKVGGFKFAESAHIKDVLAHMKVIANYHDKVSWFRILQLLDKVGPKTAGNIYEAIIDTNAGYSGLCLAKFNPGRSRGIEYLKELFSNLEKNPETVPGIGQAILKYYHPILQEKYDDHPKRTKDLEQLVTIMERYDTIETFLTDMALEPPNTAVDNNLTESFSGDDVLTLSTIHSAKGLEWDSVFIIWTLDGRFPSLYSLNSKEALEEELRLMYVASTRARENLFLTYPAQIYDRATNTLFSRPSRFLEMIPEDVLEKAYYY